MNAIAMALVRILPDVVPPSSGSPLQEPLVLFGIAVFGFGVVMLVWSRRRRRVRRREA